jgi:hypothetical protein
VLKWWVLFVVINVDIYRVSVREAAITECPLLRTKNEKINTEAQSCRGVRGGKINFPDSTVDSPEHRVLKILRRTHSRNQYCFY